MKRKKEEKKKRRKEEKKKKKEKKEKKRKREKKKKTKITTSYQLGWSHQKSYQGNSLLLAWTKSCPIKIAGPTTSNFDNVR